MKIYDIDFLKDIGLLTSKTSTIRGFTDKANSNQNIQRLYAGYEDRYETKVDVEEIDYKIPVLADWSLLSHYETSSEDRSDYQLWCNWLNDNKALYVLSNNELVKVQSVAELRAHIRFVNTPTTPEKIKTRMAEFGIAGNKVEVIDYFKSQQILAKLNRLNDPENINIFEDDYVLADYNLVKLSDLTHLSDDKLNDFILSLKNKTISLDVTTLVSEDNEALNLLLYHDIQISKLIVNDFSINIILNKLVKKSELLKNIESVSVVKNIENGYLDLLENCNKLSRFQITSEFNSDTDSQHPHSSDEVDKKLRAVIPKLKSLRVREKADYLMTHVANSLSNVLEELEYHNESGDAKDADMNELISKERASIKKLALYDVVFNKTELISFPNLTHFEYSQPNAEEQSNEINFSTIHELKFLKIIKLRSVFIDFASFIKCLPGLEELYMKSCELKEDGKGLHEENIVKRKLRKIISNNTSGLSYLVEELASVSADTLEYLSLVDINYLNTFSIDGIEVFFPKLNYLKLTMDTEAQQEDDETDEIVSLLEKSPNLQHFELKNFVNIDDDDYENYNNIKLNKLKMLIVHSAILPCIVQTLITSAPQLENLSYTESFDEGQPESSPDEKQKNFIKNAMVSTQLKQADLEITYDDAAIAFYQLASKINASHLIYESYNDVQNQSSSFNARSLKLNNATGCELACISPAARLQHFVINQGDVLNKLDKLNPLSFLLVQSLHLSNVRIDDSEHLVIFLNMMKSLRFLRLTSVNIKNIHVDEFKKLELPKLESIICEKISFHIEITSQLKTVVHLEFIDCEHYSKILSKTLKKLPFLKRLGLNSSKNNSDRAEEATIKTFKKKFPHLSVAMMPSSKVSTKKLSSKTSPLNNQTQDEGASYQPVQYFIPKDINPISTSRYRLFIHNKQAIIKNNTEVSFAHADVVLSELTDDEVNEIRTSGNLKKLYFEQYHQTEDAHYGYCPLVISSDKWTFIPSLSANEKMLMIKCKPNFKLAYSKEKNLYLIKLQEGEPKDEYNVEILLQSTFYNLEPLTNFQHSIYLNIGNHVLDNVKFTMDSNGNLTVDLPKIQKAFKESCSDYLHFLSHMQLMSFNSRLNINFDDMQLKSNPTTVLLYALIESFNHFGKGSLIGATDTAVNLLDALVKERKGACRHRASVFKVLMDFIMPSAKIRMVYSTPHAYIEYCAGGMSPVYTIDLGGYPGRIENQPTYYSHKKVRKGLQNDRSEGSTAMDGNTVYHEPTKKVELAALQDEPMTPDYMDTTEAKNEINNHQRFFFNSDSDSEDDEVVEEKASLEVVKKLTPSVSLVNNPFVTWKNVTSNQPFLDFYPSLLKNINEFSPSQQNILLTFDNEKILDNFNESVMRFQKNNHSAHFYLPSLNDIKFTANYVAEDGSFPETKSELVLFIENAKAGDVFIINWSQYKPKHIGYNTVVNTQNRQLGDYTIPLGVIVIVVMEKNKLSELREDFYSRFRVKTQIQADMEFSYPRVSLELNEVMAVNDDVYICRSWGNENWENDLLMEVIPIENNKVKMGKGHLISAIESNKKSLVIVNPPKNCDDLKLFISTTMIKGSFYLNNKVIKLPADFTIKLNHHDYDWTGTYTAETQTQSNFNLCTDVLNVDSFNNYFTAYHYENGSLVKKPGWLAFLADKTYVLVTSALADGQWAKLLDSIRRRGMIIHFVFKNHLVIPSMMEVHKNNKAVDVQPDLSSNDQEEKSQAGDEVQASAQSAGPAYPQMNLPNLNPSLNDAIAPALSIKALNKISLIVTNDAQAVIDELGEGSLDLVMSANQEMGYEIIETLEKDKTSIFDLKLNYSKGSLAEYLCAGKTVVLKVYDDALSDGLALGLESLLLANPYLIMNGKKVNFTGKLIIMSNNDNYFSFYDLQIKHAFDTNGVSALLGKTFERNSIDKLIKYSDLLDQPLSYTQMKSVLARNEIVTSECIKPFILSETNYHDLVKRLESLDSISEDSMEIELPAVPAQSAENEYQIRAANIAKMADKNPCLFLMGATGSGKSTIILETLPNYFSSTGVSAKLFVGLEKISEWVRASNTDSANAKYILFIDEANLLPKGSIDIFEDIYNLKSGLIIKGKYMPLTKDHIVIFAGNTSNYTGRISHSLNARHGCFYEVPVLPVHLLSELYIQPLIPKNMLEKASEVFLYAYQLINEDASQSVLTPRNLKNMSYRLTLLAQRSNNLTPLQAVWLSCYDEIRYLVSKETKRIFKQKMLEATNLPEYKLLKAALSTYESDKVKLPNYASTHLNARRILQQHLDLREFLIKNLPTPKFSMSELFFIGMPGVGKSSMVENYLKYLNIPFTLMRSSNQDEAEKLLYAAFHQGQVVIIDEINTMPFLEFSLNAFTMGVDLDGKPPIKKGFLIIGTGNPISFGGRYAFSPALDNRFLMVNLKDFNLDDLMRIGAEMGLPSGFVKQNAELYLATKQYAEVHDCSPMPSARDIINFFQTATKLIIASTAASKRGHKHRLEISVGEEGTQPQTKKERVGSPADAAAPAHSSGFESASSQQQLGIASHSSLLFSLPTRAPTDSKDQDSKDSNNKFRMDDK